jgi:hypothetical protein
VQLEAINADRMLSLDLPVCLPSDFDDYLEVPIEIIRKENKQFVSVDLVEPGVEALRLTGHDKVVMEATFKDKVPWIVVTLGEQPQV